MLPHKSIGHNPHSSILGNRVHFDNGAQDAYRQFNNLLESVPAHHERQNNVQQNNRIFDSIKNHFKSTVGYEGEGRPADIGLQSEYYKYYNDRLQKQFEDLLTGKGFSVYQKDLIIKPTSGNAFEELLISSDRLSPLLKALEDENKILKEEVGHLSGDLKRFIGMVELLLEENKYIREHINQKNRDITKLIETIGLNDGEEINDLKHKIHILTEENNILIKHLDEMKRFREDYDSFVFENQGEISKARDVIEKTKDDLEEALKREETLTKQLAHIEPKYSKYAQKVAELEDLVEDLNNKLNHAKNDNQTLKSEYLHYKTHYEDLSRKRGDENDQLLQENNMLMNEKKEFKQQLMFKDKQIEELKQQVVSFRKEVDTKGYDLDELSQAVNEYKNQIQIEKQRAESALARERQMRESFEIIQSESDKNHEKCSQIEKQYNKLLESSRQDIQDKHIKYEGLIEKLKIKNREDQEQKDEEITDLRSKIVEKERINQQLNNDLERRNADVSDYKKKLQELKESRSLLDRQASELIQLKNDNRDLNNTILEYKNSKSNFAGGEKEYKSLLNQIRDFEISIQSYEQNIHNLNEQINHIRIQLSESKQEAKDYQQSLALAKREIQQLKEERDQAFFEKSNKYASGYEQNKKPDYENYGGNTIYLNKK